MDHPEMTGQISSIEVTLSNPDAIVKSRTDPEVDLYYRFFGVTPVILDPDGNELHGNPSEGLLRRVGRSDGDVGA